MALTAKGTGFLFIPLWNLLCHKSSEHSCKSISGWYARPSLDLHSPEDGVSSQGVECARVIRIEREGD